MSDDRTARMDQPNWSRRETDPDEQKTVMAGQESVTPPTLPLGDQGQGGWKEKTGPAFVRSEPGRTGTPPPNQPPFGSSGPEAQTMIIKERPTPVFAWLVVVDGPDRNSIGTVHTLHPDTTTLGRVSGNRIVLHDETISAQHARIRREVKEGQEPVFALFDLGSRNGIYAGPRETFKNEENRVYRHELQDGDYLLMGETTLVFKKL
ncbi:MAG: FHA domain-containing protein [Chloroflexi bacterium]|nr:MAG: FHA domain-containing protein [Chloroflexota bacterium]